MAGSKLAGGGREELGGGKWEGDRGRGSGAVKYPSGGTRVQAWGRARAAAARAAAGRRECAAVRRLGPARSRRHGGSGGTGSRLGAVSRTAGVCGAHACEHLRHSACAGLRHDRRWSGDTTPAGGPRHGADLARRPRTAAVLLRRTTLSWAWRSGEAAAQARGAIGIGRRGAACCVQRCADGHRGRSPRPPRSPAAPAPRPSQRLATPTGQAGRRHAAALRRLAPRWPNPVPQSAREAPPALPFRQAPHLQHCALRPDPRPSG